MKQLIERLRFRSKPHVLVLIAAAVFAFAANVNAQFDSGWVWWGDYTAGQNGCRAMYLRANQGTLGIGGKYGGSASNLATECYPYAPEAPLPAGWIGARAYTYRDGGLCYSTAFDYNSGGSAIASADHFQCTNPSGNQTWYTDAVGRIWTGSSYADYWAQASLPASF